MKYQSFGQSGLKTSRLAIGTWKNIGERLNLSAAQRLIDRAIELGVTTFDTADVYGKAEETLGHILPKYNRRDIVVITKCFWPNGDGINDRGLSRKHIVESVDRSLTRLQLDYIDVMMCHRFDPTTPLRETIRTFDHLIQSGKILYWGTSEWPVEALQQTYALCAQYGWEPPVVEQAEYSLLHRRRFEKDLSSLRRETGIGLMGWSPLASGMLSGRNLDNSVAAGSLLGSVGAGIQNKYSNENTISKALSFKTLAKEAGRPMAELALQALFHNADLDCVAMGLSSLDQLNQNAAIFEGEVDDDLMARINMIFPDTTSLTDQ
jgi:aryl-alcohol dehydrogenase-like predicted oxidoreductase